MDLCHRRAWDWEQHSSVVSAHAIVLCGIIIVCTGIIISTVDVIMWKYLYIKKLFLFYRHRDNNNIVRVDA